MLIKSDPLKKKQFYTSHVTWKGWFIHSSNHWWVLRSFNDAVSIEDTRWHRM